MNKSARGASKIDPMHSLIPFLFLGLTAVPALAKNPLGAATQNVAKTPTVLVLGDSLSAGYGLKKTQAYPALLSEKAEAAGQRLHVINAGVSGDTTAGGLRRLPHLLDQPIDVFIVELGINDIFRGVPVAQIEANLQKIIDLARAHSPQVRIIIAGMQLPQTAVERFSDCFRSDVHRSRAAKFRGAGPVSPRWCGGQSESESARHDPPQRERAKDPRDERLAGPGQRAQEKLSARSIAGARS